MERLKQSSLLAINAISRDVHKNELIPRVDMAEKKKLLAEAGPEEIKTFLAGFSISGVSWFPFQKINMLLGLQPSTRCCC